MRNATDHPTAIVTRNTDTGGEARFRVLKWNLDPAKRRMTCIFSTLEQADASVLFTAKIAAASRKTSGPPNGDGSLHM